MSFLDLKYNKAWMSQIYPSVYTFSDLLFSSWLSLNLFCFWKDPSVFSATIRIKHGNYGSEESKLPKCFKTKYNSVSLIFIQILKMIWHSQEFQCLVIKEEIHRAVLKMQSTQQRVFIWFTHHSPIQ